MDSTRVVFVLSESFRKRKKTDFAVWQNPLKKWAWNRNSHLCIQAKITARLSKL